MLSGATEALMPETMGTTHVCAIGATMALLLCITCFGIVKECRPAGCSIDLHLSLKPDGAGHAGQPLMGMSLIGTLW